MSCRSRKAANRAKYDPRDHELPYEGFPFGVSTLTETLRVYYGLEEVERKKFALISYYARKGKVSQRLLDEKDRLLAKGNASINSIMREALLHPWSFIVSSPRDDSWTGAYITVPFKCGKDDG